ncbi:hypothetical protein DSECCO2_379220 [anaerobic digester metagenome]
MAIQRVVVGQLHGIGVAGQQGRPIREFVIPVQEAAMDVLGVLVRVVVPDVRIGVADPGRSAFAKTGRDEGREGEIVLLDELRGGVLLAHVTPSAVLVDQTIGFGGVDEEEVFVRLQQGAHLQVVVELLVLGLTRIVAVIPAVGGLEKQPAALAVVGQAGSQRGDDVLLAVVLLAGVIRVLRADTQGRPPPRLGGGETGPGQDREDNCRDSHHLVHSCSS